MTTWNPNRNPNYFPAHWHGLITARPGRYILTFTEDPGEPKRLMNKFNAFKACLRQHPEHESARALAKRRLRLSTEESGGVYLIVLTISWADDFVSLIEQALHPTT